MDAQETLNDVHRQYAKLRRAGLKPTMIVVGEETFVSFVKACDLITMQDALGIRQPPKMMGVRLHRTFDDQPFTVLTDGSRDQ